MANNVIAKVMCSPTANSTLAIASLTFTFLYRSLPEQANLQSCNANRSSNRQILQPQSTKIRNLSQSSSVIFVLLQHQLNCVSLCHSLYSIFTFTRQRRWVSGKGLWNSQRCLPLVCAIDASRLPTNPTRCDKPAKTAKPGSLHSNTQSKGVFSGHVTHSAVIIYTLRKDVSWRVNNWKQMSTNPTDVRPYETCRSSRT